MGADPTAPAPAPAPAPEQDGQGNQGAARGRAREEHLHRRDLDLVAASNDPKQAWSTPLSVCILRTGLIQDKPLIKPSQPSSDVVVVTPIGTQPGPLAAANLSGS